MKRKPKLSLRFGRYTKDNTYTLCLLSGRLSDGTMYALVEGLTERQARNVIARLNKDLEMVR